MKTIDQILKIEAVVLYVLQAFKEGVDYIKLYKILYFAQRESLGNYGLCLLPDSFRARDYGPVPSLTNKVVKIAEKQCSDENTVGLSDGDRYCQSRKCSQGISGLYSRKTTS